MSKSIREWSGNETSIIGKVVDFIRPQQPLRHKLSLAVKRIETQAKVLDDAINNMTRRDKFLFSKIIEAYSEHDMKRATIYANELTELRKTIDLMSATRLMLEKVALRLGTITHLGNVAAVIAPAIEMLKDIRSGVARILPSAERELDEVIILLGEIIIEANQVSGIRLEFEDATEDVQKILNEAAIIVEQRMKEKIPELIAPKSTDIISEGESLPK